MLPDYQSRCPPQLLARQPATPSHTDFETTMTKMSSRDLHTQMITVKPLTKIIDFLPRGDKNNNKFTIETTNLSPKHSNIIHISIQSIPNKNLTRSNKFKM